MHESDGEEGKKNERVEKSSEDDGEGAQENRGEKVSPFLPGRHYERLPQDDGHAE
jgi:hypothetical protein